MKEGNKKDYKGKYRKDRVFKKERSAEFCRNMMRVMYNTTEHSGSYVSANTRL
jgi:hypothetical protein